MTCLQQAGLPCCCSPCCRTPAAVFLLPYPCCTPADATRRCPYTQVGEVVGIVLDRSVARASEASGTSGSGSGGLGREACDVRFQQGMHRLLLSEIERCDPDAAAAVQDATPAAAAASSSSSASALGSSGTDDADSSTPASRHADLAAALAARHSPASGSGAHGSGQPAHRRQLRVKLSRPRSRKVGIGWMMGSAAAQLASSGHAPPNAASSRPSASSAPTSSASASTARANPSAPPTVHQLGGRSQLLAFFFRSAFSLAFGMLVPLFLFSSILGTLLAAASIVLDTPVSALVDAAVDALPKVMSSANGVPGSASGASLTPFARSLILTLLRLPPMVFATLALYVVCVPGFDLLVRTRQDFTEGFLASASAAATSNSAAGSAAGREKSATHARLDTTLAVWGRLIWLVQAARLAVVAIVCLALLGGDRTRPADIVGVEHAHGYGGGGARRGARVV